MGRRALSRFLDRCPDGFSAPTQIVGRPFLCRVGNREQEDPNWEDHHMYHLSVSIWIGFRHGLSVLTVSL